MSRIKLLGVIAAMAVSTTAFTQRRISGQFILQPGTSFITGEWKNIHPNANPISFDRKLTPSLEIGLNTVFRIKGKAGKKLVYDDISKSSAYLSDKIAFNLGFLYSFGGQNYKDIQQADIQWSRKVALQYFKVPVKVEITKGNENQTQLIYNVGFYAAYLIRYKEINSTTQNNSKVTIIAKGNTIDSTSSNGNPPQYTFKSQPYQSLDYGLVLGIGTQKQLSSSLFVQLLLNAQVGIPNILNIASQYTDGVNTYPYFEDNINTFISHRNSSIGVMLGLKKRFEWTPNPTKEKKRLRIFRLKK